jgi:hypothetical protein
MPEDHPENHPGRFSRSKKVILHVSPGTEKTTRGASPGSKKNRREPSQVVFRMV